MESKKLLSQFIKAEDFKSFKHYLLMRNESSQTEVVDFKSIQVLEVQEDALVLRMPRGNCQLGHLLTFYIFPRLPKKVILKLPLNGTPIKGSVLVTGKVSSLESLGKNEDDIINFSLSQYNEAEWTKIYQAYAKHQKSITELSLKARY